MIVPVVRRPHSGDVAEEFLRKLRPGDGFLVWYDDDTVWHDRVAVWTGFLKSWTVLTPDGDCYEERLDCQDSNEGPVCVKLLDTSGALPVLNERVYRFKDYPNDDELKEKFRLGYRAVESHALQKGYSPLPLPPQVVSAVGGVETLDGFFGGSFLARRLGAKSSVPAADGQVVVVGDVPPGKPAAASLSMPVALQEQLSKAVAAPPGSVWLCGEPLGGLSLGQEMSLNSATDFVIGRTWP